MGYLRWAIGMAVMVVAYLRRESVHTVLRRWLRALRLLGAPDPTHGRIDRDIQQQVAAMDPTSVGQRVAMENTLQRKRQRVVFDRADITQYEPRLRDVIAEEHRRMEVERLRQERRR